MRSGTKMRQFLRIFSYLLIYLWFTRQTNYKQQKIKRTKKTKKQKKKNTSGLLVLKGKGRWPERPAGPQLKRKANLLTVIGLTRSILKKISDVVTLGTFCYRGQSFINRSGVIYFFHGRRGTEPDTPPPPPPHTQSK